MAVSGSTSPIFSTCSLIMAFIFAYSASVQLNDPDWYFWFPLYGSASVVNLVAILNRKTTDWIKRTAQVALYGAILLCITVLIEAYMKNLPGFWSVDMKERVVREKIGSGLVFSSMFFHLKYHQVSSNPKRARRRTQSTRFIDFGMGFLVAVAIGLCIYFYIAIKAEMKLR